jgi:hypothetical protein
MELPVAKPVAAVSADKGSVWLEDLDAVIACINNHDAAEYIVNNHIKGRVKLTIPKTRTAEFKEEGAVKPVDFDLVVFCVADIHPVAVCNRNQLVHAEFNH